MKNSTVFIILSALMLLSSCASSSSSTRETDKQAYITEYSDPYIAVMSWMDSPKHSEIDPIPDLDQYHIQRLYQYDIERYRAVLTHGNETKISAANPPYEITIEKIDGEWTIVHIEKSKPRKLWPRY